MTHGQMIAELERFRDTVVTLSYDLTDDYEFWPAYAERANALEASCPSELRDYARESILRTIRTVSSGRRSARA